MFADIHIHSYYSHGTKIYYDGVNSPKDILIYAKRIGLDAISITDHDTLKGSNQAIKLSKKYDITVISGMEVSSSDGHILALGISESLPKGLSAEETVDMIHERGGIAIAPHPFDIRRTGIGHLARICDAIEVFNSQNLDRVSNIKAERFANKYNIPKTAGSDAHSIELIGNGIIEIPSYPDIDYILKKIKSGDILLRCRYSSLTDVTKMAIKRLKLSYNYTYRYINKHYSQPKRTMAKLLLNLVKRSPGKIDYVFLTLTYFGYIMILIYSGMRNILTFD